VEEVVIEKITPLKRDINVDLKQLRKYIEECMSNISDHAYKHKSTQNQIDQMNVTILRQLKNTNNEKDLLDREITRMFDIDRAKVAQAKNSFYNPGTKSLLPNLDTMMASGGAPGVATVGTPSIGQPSFDMN